MFKRSLDFMEANLIRVCEQCGMKKLNHMIIIGIYVNNCLIIGKDESIDCLIDELKNMNLI
jgi:uncharacterized Zn ribbon protein